MDLSNFKRIVIKIGSSLLVNENRSLNSNWLDGLIDDLVLLKEEGHEILIVSSGAIALGGNYFGIPKSKMKLEENKDGHRTHVNSKSGNPPCVMPQLSDV